MRKKRAFQLGVGAVAAAVIAGLILSARPRDLGPAPVILHYVGHVGATNGGTVASIETFCVTNQTSKTLLVHFWTVASGDGTNYTVPEAQSAYLTLSPTAAMDFAIRFPYGQYPTNAWRLRGYAAEHLVGPAACIQALLIWRRYRSGNTKLPMPNLNPFSQGNMLYGDYRQILGESVPDRNSE